MSNGSILAGSSVSSTVEYRATRVSSSDERSSTTGGFDDLIDLLGPTQQDTSPKDDTEKDLSAAPKQNDAVQREEPQKDKPEEVDTSDYDGSENAVVSKNEETSASRTNNDEPKEGLSEEKGKASAQQTAAKTDSKEEKQPMLSSSISVLQQKVKVESKEQGTQDTKKVVATSEPVKETKKVQEDVAEKIVKDLKTAKDSGTQDVGNTQKNALPKTSEAASTVSAKNVDAKTSAQKTVEAPIKEISNKDEAAVVENGKKESKTTSLSQAKTTYSSQSTEDVRTASESKNALKPYSTPEENKLGGLEREIGIKGAVHSADKQMTVSAKEKMIEEKSSDKGFLRDNAEPASGSRAQTVTSRSETGAYSNHSQSGTQDQSSGREQLRQWITEAGEVRNTAQSAQQSQFIDRSTISHLSVHALNQIMNHIERLRESDKNRVRVSLSMGDRGGISVDIKVEDGAVTTSFEGDEDILRELKRDWKDISEKASQKGVTLNDPEFISYSSSVESANSLPDSDIKLEEKSQSVIQHKDNQPMRPGLQTAAAGSSSPVHSYA